MRKGLVLLLVLTLCFNMIMPVAAAPEDDAATAHLSALELQTIEEQSQKKKINTILTTDGEHDDMASMIRYLTMANEFNTKAIVLTASNAGHHTGGDIRYPNAAAVENLTSTQKSYIKNQTTNEDGSVTVTYNQRRWTGFRWLYYYLEKYAEVYDNLKVHDTTYPTPEYLESVTKFGNIKVVGDLEEITQGSEFIKKIILENPDGEPLYIQHWGGTNTTARALKSIKEEYEGTADWDRILNKINNEVTLYMIWDNQAPTYGSYIAPNWPGIRVIVSQDCFFNFYATWTQTQRHTTAAQETWFRKAWTDTIVNIGSPLTSESLIRVPFDLSNSNIQQPTHKFYTEPIHNPPHTEADNFPFSTWGDSSSRNTSTNGYFYAEGDTPSYLCLVDNGLRSAEDPSWGGWGGRFVKANPNRPNEYRDVTGSGNQNNGGSSYTPVAVDVPPAGSTVLPKNWTFSRWIPDIQADYSVHAQWSVKDKYEDANHHPKAGVMNGLDITAAAGATVNLNGVAYDPDGDELSYKWWRYADADSHADTGTIELSDTKDATFTVPEDAEIGDTIHLIFEVSDSESNTLYTSLKNYKRVVLTVGDPGVIETDPALYGRSLTLDGTIGVNWYVSLPIAYQNENTRMQFTYKDGKQEEVIFDEDAYQTVEGGKIVYRFTYSVPAKEMTEKIKAQLIGADDEFLLEEDQYTVKEYAAEMLAGESYSDKAKAFAKALLNYGGFAQTYFKFNLTDLANKDIEVDLPGIGEAELREYAVSYGEEIEGTAAEWYGSSLILESHTTIRHYVTIKNSTIAGDAYLKYGEKTIKLIPHPTVNDIYYADIPNIAAQNLKEMYEVHICNSAGTPISKTKKYGAYTYAYNTLQKSSSDDSLKDLVKAMYGYAEKSGVYLKELYGN